MKPSLPKLTDAEKVQQYMDMLNHPLKPEAEALRTIIKTHPKINERIKWNAPSYYTHVDLVTFNFQDKKSIRLVFHHPEIVNIASKILEGDYKDRRLAYFRDMESVETYRNELTNIITELVERAEKT